MTHLSPLPTARCQHQAGSLLAVVPLVQQITDLSVGVVESALIKAKWSTLQIRKLASCSAYVIAGFGLVFFAFAKTARSATIGYCVAHAVATPMHFGSGFGQCYREVGGESSGSLAACCAFCLPSQAIISFTAAASHAVRWEDLCANTLRALRNCAGRQYPRKRERSPPPDARLCSEGSHGFLEARLFMACRRASVDLLDVAQAWGVHAGARDLRCSRSSGGQVGLVAASAGCVLRWNQSALPHLLITVRSGARLTYIYQLIARMTPQSRYDRDRKLG